MVDQNFGKIIRSDTYMRDSNGKLVIDGTGQPVLSRPWSRRLVTDDASLAWKSYNNFSVAQQVGFSSDTYLTGSGIVFPLSPSAGSRYRLTFSVTKTAAGVAAIVVNIRIGTSGSVADAAVLTFTFGTASANVDSGTFDVVCYFRSVGSGVAAVLVGTAFLVNSLASTGLTDTVKSRTAVSVGFASTTKGLIIGASYNGGASASHTVELVRSELLM